MLNDNSSHDTPPKPPVPSVRLRVSEAAERVLEQLSRYEASVGVEELADQLGKHTNTVREQLNALVESGLVQRTRSHAQGRGRPSWTYRACESSQVAGREVIGLASALAGHIEQTSHDPAAVAIDVGESWGANLAPVGGELERSVFAVLDELGFAPELDGASNRMRLHACPMADVAQEHPVVACGVHQGVIRGVVRQLGGDPDSAELTSKYEPSVCLLTISDPDDPSD